MEEKQLPETPQDVSNKEVISTLKKKNWKSYFKEFYMLFWLFPLNFFWRISRKLMKKIKVPKYWRYPCWRIGKRQAALQESIEFALGKDITIQNFLKMLRSPVES